MGLPSIKDLISGGFRGLSDTAGTIISKFKADPTKVAEFEKDLEQLKITSELEANRIGLEAERIKNAEIEMYLKDTQDARANNTKIQESDKASWLAKNVGYILDLFLGLIWGSITVFIVGKALKIVDSNADMTAVLSIYGTITAVFMMTMSFHRGTSKGSEDKSKELKEQRNK